MRHIEFFDSDHFERNYHRVWTTRPLASFIEYFWETDFDQLLQDNPEGFSDVLFPNTGYTYLINLGTPFVMQVDEKKFAMKGDGFLPRHKVIECFHGPGNRLFGIKFKVSPVMFEKSIDFSEYREYIFPISYLIDPKVAAQVKGAITFDKRVKILSLYFESIISKHEQSAHAAHLVTSILDHCQQENDFSTGVEDFAQKWNVSPRTLQRYFTRACGLSCKQTLQIMRIRKATAQLANDPKQFQYSTYGYYDYSHFYKHLRQFLRKDNIGHLQPHLKLLGRMKH